MGYISSGPLQKTKTKNMYTLNLRNEFHSSYLFYYTKDGKLLNYPVPSNHMVTFKEVSNAYFDVPGFIINFTYLGTERPDRFPMIEGEYGVLIRTQSTEVYYRYDGTGEINLTFNKFGSYILEVTNKNAYKIQLEELIVK